MSANFGIRIESEGTVCNLKLSGIFDGNAAYELLNTIDSCADKSKRIVVHTDGLRTIHPFGQVLFKNRLSSATAKSVGLVFTGPNRKDWMRDMCEPSYVNI